MTAAPTAPDPLAALAAFAATAAPPAEMVAKARACLLYGLAVAPAASCRVIQFSRGCGSLSA